MRHSYVTGTDDAHFARAENDWLAAPEAAELLEVYTCTLCGGPIFEGDEYLQVDCCGEVCGDCLEGLSAKDFALAALDLKTGAAGMDGR